MKSHRLTSCALMILAVLYAVDAGSKFCPIRCRCNDAELTVNCENAQLDVFPLTLNPKLKEIRLSRNGIASIHSDFAIYSQLEVLDLSANRISDLGEGNFALPGLRELDLSFNFVREIQDKTFVGAKDLKVLDLRKNKLTAIPAGMFSELSNLEVLDLSKNLISTISPKAFQGLRNIKHISLRANHISAIPRESFLYISQLLSLDIGSNSIAQLQDSDFYHLKQLEELQLDMCGLSLVDERAFLGLRKLKALDVQYNNLLYFPHAMRLLESLETLNIGGNLISKLTARDLRSFPRLRSFTMSHSETLQTIDDDAFSMNPVIEDVVIEDNMQLCEIPMNLFGGLFNLRRVSLRGNTIRSLDPHLLPVDLLDSFDVSDNPIECNCDIAWLWHYLQQDDGLYRNSSLVRCAGPANLEGLLLTSVDERDLDCGGNSKQGVLVAALTLFCAVLIAIGGVFLWYRRRPVEHDVDPVKTIKQMEAQTSLYAHYNDNKYPYVLQPTTLPAISSANLAGYAGLTPRTLSSYLVALPHDSIRVDTSNSVYQTLRSSMSSGSESDSSKYATIDSHRQPSSLYV